MLISNELRAEMVCFTSNTATSCWCKPRLQGKVPSFKTVVIPPAWEPELWAPWIFELTTISDERQTSKMLPSYSYKDHRPYSLDRLLLTEVCSQEKETGSTLLAERWVAWLLPPLSSLELQMLFYILIRNLFKEL